MDSRQRTVLFLLLGVQFMLAVDFSILNVALPVVGEGLGFDLDGLPWIATAFALPAAGLTLMFGRVADLLGRRRMLLFGMVLLAVGSLVGGLATSPGLLLTGRVIQGLATAIATPAALSLITTSFPEGPLRDRALGLNGALMSGGFTVGALFGGVLTDLLSWRWAFLVNVPIALVVLFVAPMFLEDSRSSEQTRLDVPGALTVSGGLLALIYGITVERWALVPGVLLLGAFWLIERSAAAPLASPKVLAKPSVRWGNLGGFLVFAMESAMIFLITLYLQELLGFSALATGLVFGVVGAGAFAGGLIGPRIIGRFGALAALTGGLVVQGVQALVLTGLGESRGTGLALVLVVMTIGGFAHVVAIVAFFGIATSGLPDGEQGLATGVATMTQQVALTAGIPVLGAVATSGSTVLGGLHTALLVDGLVTLAGAGLIFYALRLTLRR